MKTFLMTFNLFPDFAFFGVLDCTKYVCKLEIRYDVAFHCILFYLLEYLPALIRQSTTDDVNQNCCADQ